MYDRNDITGQQAGRNVNGAMKEGSTGGTAELVGLRQPDGRSAAASEDGGEGRQPDRPAGFVGRDANPIAAAPSLTAWARTSEPPSFTSFTSVTSLT